MGRFRLSSVFPSIVLTTMLGTSGQFIINVPSSVTVIAFRTAVPNAPAIPGMTTRAAYACSGNPTVYKVNSLADTNSVGATTTLRGAVMGGDAGGTTGPRVVVFERSGMIDLTDDLTITSPCITIAGQTAPSPGITLRYAGITIKTHDILLQHFRIRPGGDTCNSSIQAWNFGSDDIYNLVFDHMSTSWNQDEGYVFQQHARDANITVWRCIQAEGLFARRAGECSGGTGGGPHGMLVYAQTHNVYIIQSLFSMNQERNPYMQNGTRTVLVNNVVYNWLSVWGFTWTQNASLGSPGAGEEWYASAVGNRFIGGQLTNADANPGYMYTYLAEFAQSGNKIYQSDNTFASDGSQPGALTTTNNQLSYNPVVGSAPPEAPLPPLMTPVASSAVEAFVRANAGARPTDRDSVDTRIVSEVAARTQTGGFFPTSQTQFGGWPTLAVNTQTFTAVANPHSNSTYCTTGGQCYTNLERQLHIAAALVQP
jgi:hypothetical protein